MMDEILLEEQSFVFSGFNATTALEIGNYLTKKATELKLPIVIDISSLQQCLYHFAAVGSTASNERFIRRKKNTVCLFSHSTKWAAAKVKNDVTAMNQRYGTVDADYTILQGGFPVIVAQMGLVGSICVSGLTEQEDHNIIVEALNDLKSKSPKLFV
jgi:uncharacterized protein (UPF0303 family)